MAGHARALIRALVRRIGVDGDAIEVVFRVPPLTPSDGPGGPGGPAGPVPAPLVPTIGDIVGAVVVRPLGKMPLEQNDGRAGGGAPRHDAGNDPSRRRYTDPVSPPAVVG